MAGRQKVAILGGGVASIVAAWELTSTPELCDRYEVTVHQLGWRLGGKGASGRNAQHGQRIEEHGLHVWFGFYDNAFRVMREAYAELDRAHDAPLATWRDAFKPCDDLVLYERFAERWRGWAFKSPRNALTPGDEVQLPSFWELAQTMLEHLLERWSGLRATNPSVAAALARSTCLPFGVDRVAQEVIGILLRWCRGDPQRAIAQALRLAADRAARGAGEAQEQADRLLFGGALAAFKDWLWQDVVEPHLDDDELRMFFTMFDAGTTILVGIIEDELIEQGFDVVNDEDLRAWMSRHGAQPVTLNEGIFVRGLYDLAFAYENGDVTRPAMSAGTALQDALRMFFAYRGAFVWKMQAGMGDTVFAPFYEALRSRGVRFEFFHWVTRLGLSPDRRFVDEIEIIPQAHPKGPEYEPLVKVEDLKCWPSEPKLKELTEAGRLREKPGLNLEWEENPLGNEPLTLRRRTDDSDGDFDIVVLGISVAALEPICQELIEDPGNPRFAAMIEHSHTVMTQAFQLWLRRPVERLGWPYGDNSAMSGFVEPLDTYADMSQLLPREAWPRNMHVEDIAYFCGVLKDRPNDTQQSAKQRVRRGAIDYLRNQVQAIWPQSVARGGFDWDLLVDAGGTRGASRFDAQYWCANFQLSERYVITPPGSVQHRLKADESGYDNLRLAGDWVKTGLDGGCVEAAAMSGMQASRAICGVPATIVGEDDTWLAAPGEGAGTAPASRGLPAYVEYGGLATCPSPVDCTGATMYSFFLKADFDSLATLCRRVFHDPSAGQVDVRPLIDRVMLTFGEVAKIEPQLEPWSRMGYATERQVALWVPVVLMQRGMALQLGWFVPYMWVDNPLSLSGGREIYGYNKNWGWVEVPEAGRARKFTLDAYGGDYGASQPASRCRLIEVTATAARSRALATGAVRWDDLRDVVDDVQRTVTQPAGIAESRLEVPSSVFEKVLREGGPPQFCLRQFRAVTDGLRASPQQITAATTTVRRITGSPLLSKFDFKLRKLDSHPVATELGLQSQRTLAAFEVQMDFVLDDGTVLWEA